MNSAAVAAFSAADACAAVKAFRNDLAAVDVHRAAVRVAAAADARAVIGACRIDRTAVNGYGAAVAVVAAADACAVVAAGRGYLSAVDSNDAAVLILPAADACGVVGTGGDKLAGAVFLREDIYAVGDAVLVGVADKSLVTSQLCAVAEQEINIHALRNKVLHRYAAVNDIPAICRPIAVTRVGEHSKVIDEFRCFLHLLCFLVP